MGTLWKACPVISSVFLTTWNWELLLKHTSREQGLANFFFFFLIKGQIVNLLWFVGHVVSVPTTHLCHCNTKAATDNMKMNGWAVVQIWGTGHRVPTPDPDWLKFFKTEVSSSSLFVYTVWLLFIWSEAFPQGSGLFPQSAAEACWWAEINLFPSPYLPHAHTHLSPLPAAEVYMGDFLTWHQVLVLSCKNLTSDLKK